ncbi:hypothetical protein NP493_557g00020 [Ridgeia piscesae]|uniref:Uncharacterized protein n=1 Tax=Ridgeia piscesae TaxID=27915 RepID=A0AAD9KWQ8_RIDPI|nr:hypothetical protein NP493_557g00020 [Ridgeia piscesae]
MESARHTTAATCACPMSSGESTYTCNWFMFTCPLVASSRLTQNQAKAHLDPAVQHAQRVVEDLREAAVALAGDAEASLAGQWQAAGHDEVEERCDDQPRHAVDAPVATKRHREEVVSDHLGGKDRHHAHEDDTDAYEHLPERYPLVVVPHASSEHRRL